MRPSTTPPLAQEQPASTRPIGTAWLRLGWEHGTIARRGCTPAGANDLGRREARSRTERVSERQTGNSVRGTQKTNPTQDIQSVSQPVHPRGYDTQFYRMYTYTYTSWCSRSCPCQKQANKHPAGLLVCSTGVLCRQSDRSGLCATPPLDPSPSHFHPIYPVFVSRRDPSL